MEHSGIGRFCVPHAASVWLNYVVWMRCIEDAPGVVSWSAGREHQGEDDRESQHPDTAVIRPPLIVKVQEPATFEPVNPGSQESRNRYDRSISE